MVTHNGITGTQIARFPADGLTVIVLTNLGIAELPGTKTLNARGITVRVASFYILDLAYQPVDDQEPEFTARIKGCLTRPIQEIVDRNFVAESRWETMNEKTEEMQSYIRSLGAPQSVVLVSRERDGSDYLYQFRVIYGIRQVIPPVSA
jgi:hypothetical protein